jgi:hypothetical protein
MLAQLEQAHSTVPNSASYQGSTPGALSFKYTEFLRLYTHDILAVNRSSRPKQSQRNIRSENRPHIGSILDTIISETKTQKVLDLLES